MKRLIAIGLLVGMLVAAAPALVGLLQRLPWTATEAAPPDMTCSVKASCDAGEVAVFRMSGTANAHAGTADGSAYANVVCCGGVVALSTSCGGDYRTPATALRLWSADNAHVAQASDATYGSQVCLSAPNTVMDCRYGSSCDAGYACLATISGATNAHVADCNGVDDYGTKVCCSATCIDRLGDTVCNDTAGDPDDDTCSAAQESALGSVFDPTAWYDVYDVPVPARADAAGANGVRNRLVDIGDVLGVLFYAFADDNGAPNANGVDYDGIKGVDLDGDTDNDITDPLHQIEEGQKYDRSPGLDPDPATGLDPAGPPDGVIDIGDVLGALAQAFAVDCSEP